MNKIVLVLCLAALASCGSSDECSSFLYGSQFDYNIQPEFTTPGGIKVDPTGQDISAELVDRLVNEVEQCLAEQFPGGKIPAEVRIAAQCQAESFDLPVHRCFTVKIPDDWELACANSAEQVLPRSHTIYVPPDELCLAKGIIPTPECPCRWRAGLQDDDIIVTTPNFRVFKDPLIRMITGCNNPWVEPLATCAHSSI